VKTPLWIGIDIGTTGVRAVAYQPDGQSLQAAAKEYLLYTPQAGWAEQDPDEIVSAMESTILEVAKGLLQRGQKPDGIAISSVFHSFLAYDRAGQPVTKLMTWADNRSQEIVREIKNKQCELGSFYRRTGCPFHPMYPLTKIAWLRKERPDVWKNAASFGSIKDYVFRILTGKWVVDRSIASGSGLYDLFMLRWNPEILRLLQISESQLPEVVSTIYSRPLQADSAQRLGLQPGIPIVIGAGDGVLVNVGIGAVQPGQMSATIGTSGAIRMLTDKPRTDEQGRTWCYNLTDKVWVLGGAINNGGIALRWMRDKFNETEQRIAEKIGVDAYELMNIYAAKVPPGCSGLILLPFFAGERAPYWNADARGMLFGLNLNHNKSHLIRATMEGVCYRMNSVLCALKEVTGTPSEIRISGNFMKSKLWPQILADVCNEAVSVPHIQEGAAFGAAVLGFVATGVLKDIAVTHQLVTVEKTYQPRSEAVKCYGKLYEIYHRLYWKVQQEFTDIAAFQNQQSVK
jgi:gluconokinase